MAAPDDLEHAAPPAARTLRQGLIEFHSTTFVTHPPLSIDRATTSPVCVCGATMSWGTSPSVAITDGINRTLAPPLQSQLRALLAAPGPRCLAASGQILTTAHAGVVRA
jgi:hypothetical protein